MRSPIRIWKEDRLVWLCINVHDNVTKMSGCTLVWYTEESGGGSSLSSAVQVARAHSVNVYDWRQVDLFACVTSMPFIQSLTCCINDKFITPSLSILQAYIALTIYDIWCSRLFLLFLLLLLHIHAHVWCLHAQLIDFGEPSYHQTNHTDIRVEGEHESTHFIALPGYTSVQNIILYLIASSVILREVLHTSVSVGLAF